MQDTDIPFIPDRETEEYLLSTGLPPSSMTIEEKQKHVILTDTKEETRETETVRKR